jgi:hypothetical protein
MREREWLEAWKAHKEMEQRRGRQGYWVLQCSAVQGD